MKQKIIYVSANWVKSVIDGKESGDYVILECSWGELTEESDYVKGHIKGAYHMNTDHIEREDTNWNIYFLLLFITGFHPLFQSTIQAFYVFNTRPQKCRGNSVISRINS